MLNLGAYISCYDKGKHQSPQRMLASFILKKFLPINKGVMRMIKRYLEIKKCPFPSIDPEAYIIYRGIK